MANDLRKYARDTNIRLLAGFILILFIIGDGLIFIIWGGGAALMGFLCLLGGLAPLVLIGLALWGIDLIVKKDRGE